MKSWDIMMKQTSSDPDDEEEVEIESPDGDDLNDIKTDDNESN
jgi:hypothetical protein